MLNNVAVFYLDIFRITIFSEHNIYSNFLYAIIHTSFLIYLFIYNIKLIIEQSMRLNQ